jgi:hypothetical protein
VSISALSSSSAATQLSAFSRLNGSSSSGSISSAGSVGGTRPQKPDDGASLDAVTSALSSIGVSADASLSASGNLVNTTA